MTKRLAVALHLVLAAFAFAPAAGRPRPPPLTWSRWGSRTVPAWRTTSPLTATRPSRMGRSAPRRDVSPAWARILFSLSLAIGADAHLRDHQLAFHLREIVEVAQAERHEKLAGRLVEERPSRRFLAPGDAHQPAVEQAVRSEEHTSELQ